MSEQPKQGVQPKAASVPATNEQAQYGLNDTWPGDPYPVVATPCGTCSGTRNITIIAGTTTPEETVDCPTCIGWTIGAATVTTCIEHQAGRPTQRLSFQIKVF